MTYKWTPEKIKELERILKTVAEIEAEFHRKKTALVAEALGADVSICDKCKRPLLTRALWNKIPKKVRGMGIARRHNENTCTSHYIRAYRRKKNGIDEEQIARLRAKVGFDPNKDYDAEEET